MFKDIFLMFLLLSHQIAHSLLENLSYKMGTLFAIFIIRILNIL